MSGTSADSSNNWRNIPYVLYYGVRAGMPNVSTADGITLLIGTVDRYLDRTVRI